MHVSNTEGLHSTVSSCRTAERERVLVLYLELLTACFSSFLGIYCSLTHVLPTGKKRENEKETSREENVPEKSVNLITSTARVKFPDEI